MSSISVYSKFKISCSLVFLLLETRMRELTGPLKVTILIRSLSREVVKNRGTGHRSRVLPPPHPQHGLDLLGGGLKLRKKHLDGLGFG